MIVIGTEQPCFHRAANALRLQDSRQFFQRCRQRQTQAQAGGMAVIVVEDSGEYDLVVTCENELCRAGHRRLDIPANAIEDIDSVCLQLEPGEMPAGPSPYSLVVDPRVDADIDERRVHGEQAYITSGDGSASTGAGSGGGLDLGAVVNAVGGVLGLP
jgi:hypothetical protein